MRSRSGQAYRVTYRRTGWARGRESTKIFFTERAALRFSERLERTEDVSPVEYRAIHMLVGPWTLIHGNELPPREQRQRKIVERTVGDWSEEDDDHEAQD